MQWNPETEIEVVEASLMGDTVEQTALDAYEGAVLMPDSKDAKNFWVTLEETILKYF